MGPSAILSPAQEKKEATQHIRACRRSGALPAFLSSGGPQGLPKERVS